MGINSLRYRAAVFWLLVFLTAVPAMSLSTGVVPDGSEIRILYAGKLDQFEEYDACLKQEFASTELHGRTKISPWQSTHAPDSVQTEEIDYILFNPKSGLRDFSVFPNLKAVLSLRAGVDGVLENPTIPTHVPICRMVDSGLQQGMVEYVLGHVLRYHLKVDRQWENNLGGVWDSTDAPSLASDCTVGILGLGALGSACAKALVQCNFRVIGWSQTLKDIPGLQSFVTEKGLRSVLALSDILVLLLPETEHTRSIINENTLSDCKRGVAIINVGRGGLLDEAALLSALEVGQVSGATLDVFDTEPLPSGHPFWAHPRVLVTPHIAAKIRPSSASAILAENIVRIESNQKPHFAVNRELGY